MGAVVAGIGVSGADVGAADGAVVDVGAGAGVFGADVAVGAGAWDVAVGAGVGVSGAVVAGAEVGVGASDGAVVAVGGAGVGVSGAVGGAAGAWDVAVGDVATGLDASAGAAGVGSAVSLPQARMAKSAAASRAVSAMMYATVLILPIATVSFASFPKRAYTRIRGALGNLQSPCSASAGADCEQSSPLTPLSSL